jgi:hypothetical protein
VRTYCRLAASAAASAVDLLLGPCAIPDSLRPDGVQDAELARCMRDAAMLTRSTNIAMLLKSHGLMVSMMAGGGGGGGIGGDSVGPHPVYERMLCCSTPCHPGVLLAQCASHRLLALPPMPCPLFSQAGYCMKPLHK